MPRSMQELWTRFETWLAEHAPALRAGLQPPASEARIAAFEAELGWPLPGDLRTSLAIHDGEVRDGQGVIIGLNLNSVDEMARDWRVMEHLRTTGQFEPVIADPDVVAQLRARWAAGTYYTGTRVAALAARDPDLAKTMERFGIGGPYDPSDVPPDHFFEMAAVMRQIEDRAVELAEGRAKPVQLPPKRPGPLPGLWDGHWQRGWIPIASNGGGDSWSLDLDPAPVGTVGQLLWFDHETGPSPVRFASFTAWFADYVEHVERGEVPLPFDGPLDGHWARSQ